MGLEGCASHLWVVSVIQYVFRVLFMVFVRSMKTLILSMFFSSLFSVMLRFQTCNYHAVLHILHWLHEGGWSG